MEFKNLSSIHFDALKEIGNISAGNAATALSKLTNKKIDMDVPLVELVSFADVMELIGGPEEPIVAIHFRILGDAPGMIYFILSIKEAEELARKMIGTFEFDILNTDNANNHELAFSALMETGNILVGSYLSALSDFMKIKMRPTTPILSVDMVGAILSVGLVENSLATDSAIVIDTKITEDGKVNGVNGHFLLIPDIIAFNRIFEALGLSAYDE